MNDVRTTRQAEPAGSRRSQRGAAAVVAQYIRELSSRHEGGPLQGQTTKLPEPGCFEDPIATPGEV